jgi:hypothetical protein
MKEGEKVHRTKKGHKLGKSEEDDPIGPEETISHIYSWKWMKVYNNGEAYYVRCDEYEVI